MKLFDQIEGLVSGKLNVIKTVVSLIKLEARLAGLSVYPLLINVCMLFIVLITVWLSTMLLLGYLSIMAFSNAITAILIVLLINIMVFIGLLKYLMFNLKNMSFEKTREYFAHKESDEHGKLEKTVDLQDCRDAP